MLIILRELKQDCQSKLCLLCSTETRASLKAVLMFNSGSASPATIHLKPVTKITQAIHPD